MGNTSSTPKVTAQDRATLDLKVQRDKLRQYQKKIQILTQKEIDTAKDALAQKNRRAALLALRRKKYQETLLSRTDQQLEQLEKLASDVEFALVQKDVAFGLRRGTQVLGEINKEMGGVQGVEKLMGRNAEERAYQEEISEMLSGQLSAQDEDDVEEELASMAKESGVELPEVPEGNERLPNVPADKSRVEENERESASPSRAEGLLPA